MRKSQLPITDFVKRAYFAYFGISIRNQDKPWVPHIVCSVCTTGLRKWTKLRGAKMKFAVPMIWREPTNHVDDCYFCAISLSGKRQKQSSALPYPHLASASRPVPHSDDKPVPVFTQLLPADLQSSEDITSVEEETSSADEDFAHDYAPRPLKQTQLNDLVRDLNLPKESAELLASRLKENNLVNSEVRVTYYRNRHEEFSRFFTKTTDLVFCNNVSQLLLNLGVREYAPENWRLFIDSSKRSLKCVLLHNGNLYGSIPIAHSTTLKEKYEEIKFVLEKICYEDHKWVICVDLKMVNFLLGMQSGFTKYPCFICMWDSRDRVNHYTKVNWPTRTELKPNRHVNVINEPLVEKEKIIFPPLHIKLGLMKQFVKALNREGDCFKYMYRAFPNQTLEKLKAGIFDGPQIRKLMNDSCFQESMTSSELSAWRAFVNVAQNFLGNHRSCNYEELVKNLIDKFQEIGANMSIKMHFLFSHLDLFPENMGAVSDEQGERFHQDIKDMETRYQGRCDDVMMADYCWSIKREDPEASHSRVSKKRKFIP